MGEVVCFDLYKVETLQLSYSSFDCFRRRSVLPQSFDGFPKNVYSVFYDLF